MARVSPQEVAEALALVDYLDELLAEAAELNWVEISNRDLAVGDRIVTQFDKRSGRALKSVGVIETIKNPRGCKGKTHLKGEASNVNGCYDHAARIRIMK